MKKIKITLDIDVAMLVASLLHLSTNPDARLEDRNYAHLAYELYRDAVAEAVIDADMSFEEFDRLTKLDRTR